MSQALNDIPTIIEKFYHWEKTTPDKVFLKQPKGHNWKQLTFAEAGKEARKMTSALRNKGLQIGAKVGIYSKNCYHWILADLAIMMGGFVSVPLYANLPKEQLAEVVRLGDLDAIFLGKLDDWGDRADAIPSTVLTIKFPHYEGNARVSVGEDWNDLRDASEEAKDNYIPKLDDLWTILFTSGTTGTPKGVMHSYRSPSLTMVHEKESNFVGVFKLKELRCISYLPLNHVGERIGIELPCIWLGGCISFGESINTFAKNLQDTQPTLFFSVPRIWNKFYLGVIDKIPLKRIKFLLQIPFLSSFIKNKIKTALGMRDVEIAATGAAITPGFLKAFYKKLDIHLIEAYGMTEVCGCISYGVKHDAPIDSVGHVIPFGDIKIDEESQEILMQTPYMMLGYYKNEALTNSVFKDGWLKSGDKGSIDAQGNIRVIGRLNDTFKTSKGSFVTPNPIEELFIQNDYIEQVCVAGLGIAQPIALINLSEIALKADQNQVEASLKDDLNRVNKNAANFEKVSTVVILKENWSVENDLLTPTLKVKRGNMDKLYGQKFTSWHQAEETIFWE